MANLQFILAGQRFDTNIYSKFYSDTNKADTWKSVPVSHDKNYETGWPTRALTFAADESHFRAALCITLSLPDARKGKH